VLLSWNLGTLTSWNPPGLSRPVMGLLYLFINRVTIEHPRDNVLHVLIFVFMINLITLSIAQAALGQMVVRR